MSGRDFEITAVNNGSSPNRALRSVLGFGVGLAVVGVLASVSDRGDASVLPLAVGAEQGPADGTEQGAPGLANVSGSCVTDTEYTVTGDVTGEGSDLIVFGKYGNAAVGPELPVDAGSSFEYNGDTGDLVGLPFIEFLLSDSGVTIVYAQEGVVIDWSQCDDDTTSSSSSSSVPPSSSSSSVPPSSSSSSVPPSSSSSSVPPSSSSSSVPAGGGGNGGNAGGGEGGNAGGGEGGNAGGGEVTSPPPATTTTIFVNGLPVTG
jgi:hypothetical protein